MAGDCSAGNVVPSFLKQTTRTSGENSAHVYPEEAGKTCHNEADVERGQNIRVIHVCTALQQRLHSEGLPLLSLSSAISGRSGLLFRDSFQIKARSAGWGLSTGICFDCD